MPYDVAAPTPARQTMTEDDLVRLLKDEEADSASYYTSELAQAQADAMDRYHARPYGDGSELPNRSAVVTHDIEDTINWIMPHLMRAFQASDELVSVDDDGLDDGDPVLSEASNYLRHVLFKDNDGDTFIHDFCFDGLLQKIGVARVYWCPPEPKAPQIVEGVPLDQLARYVNDPEYQIIAAAEDGVAEPMQPPTMAGQQMMPGMAPMVPQPEPTFTLLVQRTPRVGRAKVECVPPEEFRVSRRAKSLDAADYHAWKFEEFLANLIRMHPDKAHVLDPDGYSYTSADDDDPDTVGDERIQARFPDEPATTVRDARGDEGRRKVTCIIEYLRIDYDGDNVVELRRIKRCGDIVLENDIVEESEFVAWTPIRVSHRLIGRSLADTLLDIQKIRTALMRRAMDSLSRSLAPRTVVSKQAVAHDPTLLDRFLDHDVGDVLEVNGNPRDVVMELVTPDVSNLAFQAIEYMDRRSEEASGVNRHAMGIQPRAITDTKGGIENLQAAANSRVEQVARWLGLGLEQVFAKVLRLLTAHQDHARIVKINGKRMQIDPRRWSDEMTVSVHVGLAAETREKKLVYLNAMAGKQEQVLLNAGPANPLCGFAELRNTYAEMAQIMGYRNAGRFWKDVDPNWQPEPTQDPKAIEAQAKAQMAQAELQQKGQIAQAELQGKMQLQAADTAAKQRMAEQEAGHRQELARFEAELKAREAERNAELQRQIAEMKLAAEQEMARIKLASEEMLTRERMAMEERLATERMLQEAAFARIRSGSSGDGIDSFREGGRLDA